MGTDLKSVPPKRLQHFDFLGQAMLGDLILETKNHLQGATLGALRIHPDQDVAAR